MKYLTLVLTFLYFYKVHSTAIERYTEDNTDYQFIKIDHDYFIFKVKASNDVHVGLFTTPSKYPTWYEIVVGGWANTKSVIRKNDEDVFALNTKGLVNKNQFRTFWVRFNKKAIIIGEDEDFEPIMVFRDPAGIPKFSHIGIHTGFGATGKWVLTLPNKDWKNVCDRVNPQ